MIARALRLALVASITMVALAILFGCKRNAATVETIALGNTTAPVRDAFNAAAGNVRVVMLVSPT
jgi:hypothetical protein